MIESPAFLNHLQAMETLGLKVVEIPSSLLDGINLKTLAYVLEETPVKACLLVPNFSNPNGRLMPDDKKKELLRILYGHDVPLIEDDIRGDLSFSLERPRVVKSYDKRGLVIVCSSFSKTLAPGIQGRLGHIIGAFQPENGTAEICEQLDLRHATPDGDSRIPGQRRI
jgi:DNA-binding transcriptional MocR family regulator